MGINQQLALIASFSLALMLSVLSYLTVSVHFVLAWNQYHHDGDNLFFVPFTLLVFVTAAIAALGYLGLRKHGKSVFVCFIFLSLMFLLAFYKLSLFWAALFVLPLFSGCLAGVLLASGLAMLNHERARGRERGDHG